MRNVEIVGLEFAPEAFQVGARSLRVTRPGFGEDCHLIARDVLERLRYMRMAAVSIRRIDKAQAVVVAVQQEIGKLLDPKIALV